MAEKPAQSTTYKNVSQLIVVVGRFKFLPNEAGFTHKYLNELHAKKLKRLVDFDMQSFLVSQENRSKQLEAVAVLHRSRQIKEIKMDDIIDAFTTRFPFFDAVKVHQLLPFLLDEYKFYYNHDYTGAYKTPILYCLAHMYC